MSIDTLSSFCWYNCCTLPTVSEILNAGLSLVMEIVYTSSTSSSAFHIEYRHCSNWYVALSEIDSGHGFRQVIDKITTCI